MRLPKFRCKNKVGNWCFFTVLHNGNVNEENFNLETLSEFTGLLDKQGKEIYEGDIVKDGYMNEELLARYECVFYEGAFKFKEHPMVDKDWWIGNITPLTRLEVIGNLYENPELLEQK